ncbi:MAG: trehalose-phosphatase [Tannerellaceae bacterium]|nr:trehalose-phosphatase [Tannerellaceae bacterium]
MGCGFYRRVGWSKEKNDILKQKIIGNSQFNTIKTAYDKAKHRLILLDYDGTLVPFYRNPLQAKPTKALRELLGKYTTDTKNKVVITSGREFGILDKWLGDLPLDMAAEHGAFYKEKGVWHEKVKEVEWDKDIVNILEHTVKKTPKSRLEIKKTALVWHYRDVDPWLADLRVNQLINALMTPCALANLQIMRGNKIVKIKQSDFSKGAEAMRIIEGGNYDFILAVGDDTTDEEMFMALPEDAATVKVGKASNVAHYNIPTQQETVAFLKKLIVE